MKQQIKILMTVMILIIVAPSLVNAQIDENNLLFYTDFKNQNIADIISGETPLGTHDGFEDLGNGNYAVLFDGATNILRYSGDLVNPVLHSGQNVTIGVRGKLRAPKDTSGSWAPYFGQWYNSENQRSWLLIHQSTAEKELRLMVSDDGNSGDSITTSPSYANPDADVWFDMIVQMNATHVRYYVDEQLIEEHTNTPLQLAGNRELQMGAFNDLSTNSNAGFVAIDRVFILEGGAETINGSEATEFLQTGLNITDTQIINVQSPVRYQTFQRNVNNNIGQINISLTTTGIDNGETIQANFNNRGWQNIGTVQNNQLTALLQQQSGSGTLQLRLQSNTSVTNQVLDVSVGDIYLLIGQSNTDGRGDEKYSYNTSLQYLATMFQQTDRCSYRITSNPVLGSWKINNDPTGYGNAGTCGDFGSQWPLIANNLIQTTSVPIAWVPASYGGTSITLWAGEGTLHYDRAIEMLSQATNGDFNIRGVLWHQGESDHSMAEQTYYNHLQDLYDDLSSTVNFEYMMVSPVSLTGVPYGGALGEGMQRAQRRFVEDNNNVVLGPESYDIELATDNLHFKNDAELRAFADRYYKLIAKEFYNINYVQPKATNFWVIDNNTLRIDYNTNIEISDWLFDTNNLARGFLFTDADSNTLSSLNYTNNVNANKLTFIFQNNLSLPISVTYANTNTGYKTSIVRNSNDGLSALRIYEQTFTPLVSVNIPQTSVSEATKETRNTVFIALGLIAVILLAGAAFAVVKTLETGMDTATTIALITAMIGTAIILIVGFIVINQLYIIGV